MSRVRRYDGTTLVLFTSVSRVVYLISMKSVYVQYETFCHQDCRRIKTVVRTVSKTLTVL